MNRAGARVHDLRRDGKTEMNLYETAVRRGRFFDLETWLVTCRRGRESAECVIVLRDRESKYPFAVGGASGQALR